MKQCDLNEQCFDTYQQRPMETQEAIGEGPANLQGGKRQIDYQWIPRKLCLKASTFLTFGNSAHLRVR